MRTSPAPAPGLHRPRRAHASHLGLSFGLALVFALGPGCRGTGTKSSTSDGAPEKPIADLVEATNAPEPIGQLLARIDTAIERWNQLHLSGKSGEDREKARKLELWIQGEAHRRRAEIVAQLEGGAPQNRTVAAMALGFTREAEVQSPLLAALDDAEPSVVSNALLGLWLLERADTPLERIATLLRTSPDPTLRSNAALCLASLTSLGAKDPAALEAARLGLLDDEAGVRSQCALILGNLVDADSIDPLADHLVDPVPLVAAASARSLAHIGRNEPSAKGKAARALVAALEESKGAAQKEIRASLIHLAGMDKGKDTKDWLEWALRLP
ncbi:MAG: HEAT repeat domain-containing protein [Planctomycetes bacterium]|nr:HEAT repeat domain-containing protein [Planctomycetota bacterium]